MARNKKKKQLQALADPTWINYPRQHSTFSDRSELYNDYCNHCRSWRQMIERSSKITSAHECTHGTNSELRMRRSEMAGIKSDGQLDITFVRSKGVTLIQPRRDVRELFFAKAGKVNGFYVGGDRAIMLPEPGIRKSTVAKYIPSGLRGMRFSTYITGQRAWDDTPLYIFDEWVAYNNGTATGVDLNKLGDGSGRGTDQPMGPLEFFAYALGLCRAVEDLDSGYYTSNPQFTAFMEFELYRAFATIQEAIKRFPWSSAQQYLDNLRSSNLPEIAKRRFNFDIDNPVRPDPNELDFSLLATPGGWVSTVADPR